MPITRFESIVSASTVGTADIEKLAASFDKVSASIDRTAQANGKIQQHPGFDAFAQKVKQGIQDPLGAIADAAEGALRGLGPVGAGVAAGAAALGAFAIAGIDAARSLGEYATGIQNVSIRTGLTTNEVGKFSYAARLAGQDVGVFESAMRVLSQGLEDGSAKGKKAYEGLQELGVSAFESSGKLKPMSTIFLQLSEGLNRIEDPAKRNSEALKVFGRAGIEILPTILKLAEGAKHFDEAGLGISDKEIQRMGEYKEILTDVDTKWDRLITRIKEFTAAPVLGTWDWFQKGDAGSTTPSGNPKYGEPANIGSRYPEVGSELLNRGLYAPAASANLLSAIEGQFNSAGRSGAASLQSYLGAGLLGAQARLSDLKQSYEDARSEAEKLARAGSLLPDVAARQTAEVEKARKAYQAQADLVKELEKDESKRISNLEKMRDLVHQGIGFYQIGSGADATILPSDKLAEANPLPRGLPSLYGRRQYNPFLTAAALNGETAATADFGQGLQVIDGQLTFVSPEASRGLQTQGENVEILNSRQAGAAQLYAENNQTRLSNLRAETDAVAHILDLRSGPGGEWETAKLTAKLREDALREELSLTGDVGRYREESKKNELDLALKLAELEKQRSDQARSLAGGLFESAFGGGKGIESFLSGFLKSEGRTVIENIAEQTIGNKSLSLGLPGKIFSGTIFGQDPLKDATAQNTLATVDNTNALRALSLSRTGGGGGLLRGGGLPGIYTGGGSSSGNGGGYVSTGTPGYTSDGWQTYSPENYDDQGNFIGPAGGSDPSAVGRYSGYNGGSGSGLPGWASAAGVGAAAVGGGLGIYSGINTGGARGASIAAGSALASAGSIISLLTKGSSALGPIGLIAGSLIGTLLPALLGDPRQLRAKQLQQEAQERSFTLPSGANYTTDIYGNYADSNVSGGVRAVHVTNSIFAMDSQSFADYLNSNPNALSTGIATAIAGGNAEDTVGLLKSRINP